MNEEVLNATVRKFLKKVGITSQREIELAVRDAVANGRLLCVDWRSDLVGGWNPLDGGMTTILEGLASASTSTKRQSSVIPTKPLAFHRCGRDLAP